MMETFVFLFLSACFVFGFAYFFIILFYLIQWNKIKPATISATEFKTFVSVVIAARNEEENIAACLSTIIKQNYPAHLFEIIIVNDFSEDQTGKVVSDIISNSHSIRIRLINLSEYVLVGSGSKKMAIHHGIQNAQGTLIVTTDADCTMSNKWLHSIVSYYEDTHAQFISSPVVLKSGTFFQNLQSIEFMSLIGSGAAAIRAGYPLMCNAANLAFEKSLYMDTRSEEKIFSEPATGDDTFLMFAAWKKNTDSIAFLKSADAIVQSNPVKTISAFISQRKRWVSKVKNYSVSHVKIIGVIIFLFHMLLFISGLLSVANNNFFFVFITMFVLKAVPDFLFLHSVTGFFNKRKLLLMFIPATVLHVFYMIAISVIAFGSSYTWKGRKS